MISTTADRVSALGAGVLCFGSSLLGGASVYAFFGPWALGPQKIVDSGNLAEWATVVATCIAVVASLLTYVHQSEANRANMRKLQRPHIDIYPSHDTVEQTLAYELRNDGLGPAFVKRFRAFDGDRELDCSKQTVWVDFASLHIGPGWKIHGGPVWPGTVIPAGKTLPLFECKPHGEHDRRPMDLDGVARAFRIAVEYCSNSDEEFRTEHRFATPPDS